MKVIFIFFLFGDPETNFLKPLWGKGELIAVSLYWHERAAFQRSAFGRSTADNDVVATVSISLFSFFYPVFSPIFYPIFVFSVATFSHRRSPGIKKLI